MVTADTAPSDWTPMNRPRPLPVTIAVAVALLLAACGSSPSPSPSPLDTRGPKPTPEATATPTPEATPRSASPEASPSVEASPSPDAGGEPGGGFTVAPNPEADTLFLDRDECENVEDGYRVQFPEAWYTNTEIGSFPPCVWFAAEFYEVEDEDEVPDEIAINIERINGDFGFDREPDQREEVTVGGAAAVRITFDDAYFYIVQLGATPEEGPNLVARTTTEMGGDYALNKAVLDRIMATMEFIGSIS